MRMVCVIAASSLWVSIFGGPCHFGGMFLSRPAIATVFTDRWDPCLHPLTHLLQRK